MSPEAALLQRDRPPLMLQLLADRFICDRGRWFDLATARPVNIRWNDAGSKRAQFEWSDRCSTLSRLRHPLLNPLLDYGQAAAGATFEAYGILPPLAVNAHGSSHAATHAMRFLRAHAVVLDRDLASLVVRRLQPQRRSGRPLGIVLQPRRVIDALADALDGAGTGPLTIAVSGPPRSGMTTVRCTFARVARLAGYIPLAVEAARRWPEVNEVTAGRHVCVISNQELSGDASTTASWLARLGLESTRRHLHLTFVRSSDATGGALRLDPLGVAAMRSMVYKDPDFGPTTDEICAAARVAGGWPGQFLAALRAEPLDRSMAAGASTIHESSLPYAVGPDTDTHTRVELTHLRLGSAASRAERRASALAAAGRHAAAVRLLSRAIRLLEGRGSADEAARCAARFAWILRSRGETERAETQSDRARSLARNPQLQTEAALVTGVLWTDEGRFPEAEAALRGALGAATTLQQPELARRASLALARALLWQERTGDALVALEGLSAPAFPGISCEALALAARIHVAAGDVAAALGAASQALQRSASLHDPRLTAAAHRSMAMGLILAGDFDGAAAHVRNGLRAASRAHQPLAALRLRAVLLIALERIATHDERVRHLRDRLQRALRHRPMPQVVRVHVERALDAHHPPSFVQTSVRCRDGGEIAAELVDAAQRAADETGALSTILSVISDRLQASASLLVCGPDASRVLATYGRTWRERSLCARRSLECGLAMPVDRARQPPEAAEPVKYAGQTIAALACRWPAGTTVDPAAVSRYLSAAALALSTHVHAVLDVREPAPAAPWGDLLGDSAAAVNLREAVQRAARAPFPVLIEGESGSGKELVARAIHRLGPRRDRRFCAINCAAITDELVESELFGHTRGAFTGAATDRAGLFEEADGGSLFLDEIGELSPRAQAKLLRVLQDGEVRRVGESFPRRVDVRVIAATNRRLDHEVAASRFRADLHFRLDVIRITVPALRDRVADIAILAEHFWRDASARVGSRATLGPEMVAALSRYDWPGNVRELQNAIAWIAVHAPRRGRIGAALLPSRLAAAAPLSTGSFEAAREDFERRFVRAALAQTGGHRARTAEVLGVSRQGLAKMLRRLGIRDG